MSNLANWFSAHRRFLPLILIPAVVLLALVAVLDLAYAQTAPLHPSVQTAPASVVSVTISGFAFNPSVLTITAGTTVSWTNQDTVTHTTTSDSGSLETWNSGLLSPDGKGVFTKTFDMVGSFPYHCSIHTDMHGTIIVLPAAQTSSQVTIAGPTDGVSNTAYVFTATVSPMTVTQPITFVWQATNQMVTTHVDGLTDTITFTWPSGITGAQFITTTATNATGPLTGTHLFILDARKTYLPFLAR